MIVAHTFSWVKQNQASGSFKEKDNRTPKEEELIKLRKENQRLLWNMFICRPF